MKITELDHDALSLLSALVAPNDVGSWRLACRTLGEAAHPYRFRRLVLRTPTQLRDVCESVVKTPDCARHILYLTMGNGCLGSPSNWGDRDFRDSLIPHIADLMRAAVNLVSLTMESAESFLANSPTLVAAVTVCSRLETLVLEQHHWEYEDLSHGTAALFAALRAPLRVLKLSSINNGEFPVHIFTLLQHVTPTLESLDMNLVEIEPWSEQGPAPVFPRVTTLYLRYASAHVQTLEAAFPMLRELMLELDNGLDPYMYAENTAYMLAHWKHLAILSGGIGSLWTLALRDVEVDLLMMNDYARDEEGMEARRAVLRGVRPHMLHVCVCADIEGETLIAHDLPECAPAVRILDLDVSLERCSGALNAQVVMTFLLKLPALLKSMSELVDLRFLIVPIGLSSRFSVRSLPADVRVTIAQELFAQVDSLTLITLCWAEAGWFSTTYRRVDVFTSDGGTSGMSCVPDEHLEELIGRLCIEDLNKMRNRLGNKFDRTLRSLASHPEGGDDSFGKLFADDSQPCRGHLT